MVEKEDAAGRSEDRRPTVGNSTTAVALETRTLQISFGKGYISGQTELRNYTQNMQIEMDPPKSNMELLSFQ